MCMETARKPVTFRLNAKLLDMLKERAKANKQSLNKYVENVLLDALFFEPNETTEAAIEEARTERELDTLDLDKFKTLVDSL